MLLGRPPLSFDEWVAHFWSLVDIKGPDECWPWLGHTSRGYGHIYAGGRSVGTHRVAFALGNGGIDPSLMVLHSIKCTTRRCCNYAHLRQGTHDDNMQDKSNAGVIRGARNPNTMLTEEVVLQIRSATGRQKDIARAFQISQQQVSNIKRKEHWSHI